VSPGFLKALESGPACNARFPLTPDVWDTPGVEELVFRRCPRGFLAGIAGLRKRRRDRVSDWDWDWVRLSNSQPRGDELGRQGPRESDLELSVGHGVYNREDFLQLLLVNVAVAFNGVYQP
jgi:hypothetical protein